MRTAANMEPQNRKYQIAFAMLLWEMERYDEANEVLILAIEGQPDLRAECFFHVGLNCMAMGDLSMALNSFKRYLKLEPNGKRATECMTMIDLAAQHVQREGESDDQAKAIGEALNKGQKLVEQGQISEALDVLESARKDRDYSAALMNVLATLYALDGQTQQAEELACEVLSEDSSDIHAICNLAAFAHRKGNEDQARERIRQALRLHPATLTDINKLAVTLCELEMHEEASAALGKMLEFMPYDRKVLSYSALACYNCGKIYKAMELWKKLRMLDETDTVAEYYAYCTAQRIRGQNAVPTYTYSLQVPVEEIVRRIRVVNQMLHEHPHALDELWDNAEFRKLVMWGTELNDPLMKRAMIQVLYAAGKENAERDLRRIILRKDQPDEIKRDVFALLKQMGAKEPYFAVLDGSFNEVQVSVFSGQERLWEEKRLKVVLCTLNAMHGRYSVTPFEVIDLWEAYVSKAEFTGRNARYYRVWAAALEQCVHHKNGQPISGEELARTYGVSLRSIRKYAQKIMNTLEE